MGKEEILAYLRAHKEEFRKRYGIVKLGLHESYATGKATPQSDIDIFYERDRNSELKSGLEFMALSEKIAHELHVKRVDMVKLDTMNPIVKLFAQKDFIYV